MSTDVSDLGRKAEAGSCVAQTVLGWYYLYGREVEVNYKEAFRFLSAAAEQGASRAVLNLGHMHAQGLGVPQDIPEAIRLFEAVGSPASSTDAFAARIKLGRIFSRGIGIPVNVPAALKWYSAANELASGDEDSKDLREARAYVAQAGK